MSPKYKEYNIEETKMPKRQTSDYEQIYVDMLTGTVSKVVPKLPDEYNPVVVRFMTRSELAAIPRDRYHVRVIRVATTHQKKGEFEGEEELLVAITNSEQLTKHLKSIRYRIRLGKDDGGGSEPPSDNPFKEPIDQHKIADSIIQVMDDFFHGEDKCTIYYRDFSKMEFCVLMHIFFKKINFLKKETRLQFSKFMQDHVFAGKSGFIRSYNTYADKAIYKAFDKQLDINQYDFKNHPVPPEKKPIDYHQCLILELSMAFQEIGRAFQKTAYFKELKKLQKTVKNFYLQ